MENQNHRYGSHTNLQPQTQKIFDNIGTAKQYQKNEPIYFQGDSAQYFYYIKRGQAKVFMNSSDGMEVTLNVTGKGNVIGEAAFFDEMPRVSSAKALSKAEIQAVDRKMLISLFAKHPQLAMEFLTLQAKTIRVLSTQIDNMAFLQADVRIAQLLLQSFDELNGEKIVSFTHEEIGNIVGVTRVTVSKTLAEFTKKGLVYTKYRKIVIKNADALANLIYSYK